MTVFRQLSLLAVATMLVMSMPLVTTADEPADEGEQRALAYYEEAGEAFGEGRYHRAAELLELAYEYDPILTYRYNQIIALEGAGDYEKALELIDQYEDQMVSSEEFADIVDIREDLQEAIAQRSADDEVAEADDEDVEELDEPADVKPVERDLDILGWSLTGVGAASFGTGVVVATGVLIDDTIDRLETSASEGVEAVYGDNDYDRDADISTLKTHQWLSAGLLVGGVAASATGGALLWSSRSSGEPAPSVQLHPAVDNHTFGAMLKGKF